MNGIKLLYRKHVAPDESFLAGVLACGPTILGYWSIGFAAGSIGALQGFAPHQIVLLAGFLYAGSAQFMLYSLSANGAGIVPIVLSVLLINLRYLLMSSYIAGYFKGKGRFEKFLAGVLLTDETFGVACQYAGHHGVLPFRWLLGLNLTAYGNWIFANLMGAVFASSLPASLTRGLGFSLTAMFIGLLLMTYFSSKRKALELVGIAIAVIVVICGRGHLDPNVGILLATAVAALCAVLLLRLAAYTRRATG